MREDEAWQADEGSVRGAWMRRPAMLSGCALATGQAVALATPRLDASWTTLTIAVVAVAVALCVLNARRGWIPLLLALAFTRANVSWNESRALETFDGPVVGLVESVRGSRVTLSGDFPSAWEFDFERPPRAGEAVAVLPPGEWRPWVRAAPPFDGGPNSLGVRSVATDEAIRLGEAPRILGHASDRLADWRDTLRSGLVERARRMAPGVGRGLSGALLVGDRSGLDPSLTDLFTRTGTRHLIALSGLHVALLTGALLIPCAALLEHVARRLGLRPVGCRRLRSGICLLGLGTFAFLCGGAPPVVRAALALGTAIAAPHAPPPRGHDGLGRGRRADGLSIWGAALTLECLLDPHAVQNLSVSLSYAATLGILLAAGRLSGRDSLGRDPERVRVRGRLGAGLLCLVEILFQRFVRGLHASVACSLAAVLATLPIAWTVFGEFAPVGIPATVCATPLIAALLVLDWIAVTGICPPVTPLVSTVEFALISLLEFCDRAPASPMLLPPRPFVLITVSSLATLAVCLRPRRHTVVMVLVAWILLVRPSQRFEEVLRIDLLDVGHGTCVVIRAPDGDRIVFDCGSRDRPGLVRNGLGRIARAERWKDAIVVLSHGDFDHWSGLPWLATRVPIESWWGHRVLDLAPGTAHLDVQATPGRVVWHSPNGLSLTLVRGRDDPGNEGSRSLIVDWRGRRILLTGDAVGEGLAASIQAGLVDGHFDLALLPHHGSHGPELGSLLDRLDSDRLWISCEGRPPIADELDRRDLTWHATGREGPLALELEPGFGEFAGNPGSGAD